MGRRGGEGRRNQRLFMRAKSSGSLVKAARVRARTHLSDVDYYVSEPQKERRVPAVWLGTQTLRLQRLGLCDQWLWLLAQVELSTCDVMPHAVAGTGLMNGASWENKRSRSVIPVTYASMLMKVKTAQLVEQLEILRARLWIECAEWDDPILSRRLGGGSLFMTFCPRMQPSTWSQILWGRVIGPKLSL